MPRRPCCSSWLAPLWLLAGWGTLLADGPPPTDGLGPPASLAVWDHSIDLRSGVGYKDNVLFGSTTREASAFETTGLDLILLRLSASGALCEFFLSGDDTRYFQARDVDKEQSLVLQGEVKQSFGNDWKAAFVVRYFYQNQVYDASITETNFTAVKARGHNLSVRPSLRRGLGRRYWTELELDAERQWFAAPLQNYWQGGPRIALGRDLARQSELALSYSLQRRGYNDFNQIDLEGASLPGTTTAFWIHQAELAWRWNWDARRRWRSTTRLIYGLNQDNGPGFFNYREYRFIEQVRFQTRAWQFEGRGSIAHYAFDRQTVSPTDSSKRHRTNLAFSVRAERKLTRSLRAFADYAYERSLSNLNFDRYQVNQVSGGLDWEF